MINAPNSNHIIGPEHGWEMKFEVPIRESSFAVTGTFFRGREIIRVFHRTEAGCDLIGMSVCLMIDVNLVIDCEMILEVKRACA